MQPHATAITRANYKALGSSQPPTYLVSGPLAIAPEVGAVTQMKAKADWAIDYEAPMIFMKQRVTQN